MLHRLCGPPSIPLSFNLAVVLPRCSSRCFELNHMLHRLCGPPSIPLSFNLAVVLPRWSAYCVCCGTEDSSPTPSTHRLRRGLPGYLILFAPHAFEPQRQFQSRKPPSPLGCGTEDSSPTPSTHRLRRGLPGYLILFAPHAFEPQRQFQSRKPPSPLVFFLISTHFTATLGIPSLSVSFSPESRLRHWCSS